MQHYCTRLLPRMRAASRPSGQGWRMRAWGNQAAAMLGMRSQVSRVFCVLPASLRELT